MAILTPALQHLPYSTGKSLFILLPLPCSMLQVTSQALVVCTVNVYMQWNCGGKGYSTMIPSLSPSTEGMCGVAHALLFFSFSHNGIKYPCALMHWFSCTSDSPNNNTSMWEVEPDLGNNGMKHVSIIHLDTIAWAAHLLPVFGWEFVSHALSFMDTLDTFATFYVSKYIDHHAFKIAL